MEKVIIIIAAIGFVAFISCFKRIEGQRIPGFLKFLLMIIFSYLLLSVKRYGLETKPLH